MKLKNKAAIVTGSTRGIGEAVARAFYEEGAKVVVSGRDEAVGKAIVEDMLSKGETYSGAAIFVKADVSKCEDIEALRDRALSEFGSIDILVNNAGVNAPFNMLDMPMNAWDKVMNIDLKGVVHGTAGHRRRIGKAKTAARSSISPRSLRVTPSPAGGPYGPAKSAVVMLTKQCAMEWAKEGVRVNAISPGLILTPLSENIYKDEEVTRTRKAIIPLGRIGRPEDVANLAVFLASDDSSYITAQDILVDGGLTDCVYQQLPGRATIKEPM